MSTGFEERLGYSGDVDAVVARAAAAYDLGLLASSSLVEVGFEDYNLHIKAESGEFLLKIFGKFRDEANAKRYVDVIEAAIEGGVNHPRLLSSTDGESLFKDSESGLMMSVLEYVHGKTFMELGRIPSDGELNAIAKEVVKINRLDIRPEYVFDSWAVPNIEWVYEKVEPFLSSEDKSLAGKALEAYSRLTPENLPKCFVHGDITKANVLLGDDGKIYILDFAVSNIYPRIQELAIMAGNLMFSSDTKRAKRLESVKNAYLRAGGTLTDVEVESLDDYGIAGVAMELLGAIKAKNIDNINSEEADEWAKLGRAGLAEAFG